MKNGTYIIALRQPKSLDDPLTEIAQDGTRRMLVAALRAEADASFAQYAGVLRAGVSCLSTSRSRTLLPSIPFPFSAWPASLQSNSRKKTTLQPVGDVWIMSLR